MSQTEHKFGAAGVLIRSRRKGATTTNGRCRAPWRVVVAGRELSTRELGDVAVHLAAGVHLDGLEIRVFDAEGYPGTAALANEAVLGEWLNEHLKAGR